MMITYGVTNGFFVETPDATVVVIYPTPNKLMMNVLQVVTPNGGTMGCGVLHVCEGPDLVYNYMWGYGIKVNGGSQYIFHVRKWKMDHI